MDVSKLTPNQRQQRRNIRNAFLTELVETLEQAKEHYDEFGKVCLQEMIDKCHEEGVDSFASTSN